MKSYPSHRFQERPLSAKENATAVIPAITAQSLVCSSLFSVAGDIALSRIVFEALVKLPIIVHAPEAS